MDGIPAQPISNQPSAPIPQQSFFQTPAGKITALVGIIVILLTALVILNYFNILPLLKLTKSTTPVSQTSLPSPTPQKLTLSCPVPQEFCKQGMVIKDGDKYLGIGYSLPVGTKIYAAISGNAVFGGTEDKSLGITTHSKIIIGESNSAQAVTYEFFGLPQDQKIPAKTVAQGEELGAVWGGSFPNKPPYSNINLLFYVESGGKTAEINPEGFAK